MDENNKNKNDKVSRIEDFTTSKKDNNDKDDVSFFRRNKDFRNRKRKRFGDRVNNDEYSNEETQENDVPDNDSPEMESTNEDKKIQSENEHDKDSLNHGDEAIQHHKDFKQRLMKTIQMKTSKI